MAGSSSFPLALTGIGLILAAMLAGPAFSPPEFDWLRHSTSEQAAQTQSGAWIMRAGFVAYGIGTALGALADWRTRPLVRAALLVFGIGLIGTAIWSNAPIVPDLPANLTEDFYHSVASGVVGTAFAGACAARLFTPGGGMRDGLSWAGLLIAVAIPLAMSAVPEYRGALQRGMFAFSFVFVLREFYGPER
ncbi:MAG: DUF998 domain-containing protein [Alphaproteobacteria bacterium]|nr:DUF998 domain-containing protein [Alphaproteobacteria bacterium]NNF24509.1 DUF998 domain-containing protein [Paracoccaceae bacterium]